MASNTPVGNEKLTTKKAGLRGIMMSLWPRKTNKHVEKQEAIVPQSFETNKQAEETNIEIQHVYVGASRSMIHGGFTRDTLADGTEHLFTPSGKIYVTSITGEVSMFQYTTIPVVIGSLNGAIELSSEIIISDKLSHSNPDSEASSYSSTLLGEGSNMSVQDKPAISALIRYNPSYDETAEVSRDSCDGYVRDRLSDGTELLYSPRGKLYITSPRGELSEFEYELIPEVK